MCRQNGTEKSGVMLEIHMLAGGCMFLHLFCKNVLQYDLYGTHKGKSGKNVTGII